MKANSSFVFMATTGKKSPNIGEKSQNYFMFRNLNAQGTVCNLQTLLSITFSLTKELLYTMDHHFVLVY